MLKKSSPLKQLGQMEPNLEGRISRIVLGGHICWWNGTKWRNFIEVWFHLAKLLQRKRLKYEKVNGRTMAR
jgi:hypothetical protein